VILFGKGYVIKRPDVGIAAQRRRCCAGQGDGRNNPEKVLDNFYV
jgi:hypothetical protein